MSKNNRVIWSEGMFLRPQHFQQQGRYIDTLVAESSHIGKAYEWGISKLKIDQRQLSQGKFVLAECCGIFSDGTPFNLPEDDPLPPPIEIPVDVSNSIVYLSLPARLEGSVEVDSDEKRNCLARYHATEIDITDHTTQNNETATLTIGKLQNCLLLAEQERAGHTCIGIARIIESRVDKNIILDNEYLTPSLDCHALPRLKGFIKEISGLLHTRGEALAVRASEAGRGGVAEISDFMLLQAINRFEPLFEHLQNITCLHPEDFYRQSVQLAGELSTFSKPNKRPVVLPAYQHDNLQLTFDHVMEEIRDCLSVVMEQNAIPLPLTSPKYGTRAAKIPDDSLLDDAFFVLAVKAEVPNEQLLREFPTQLKIGPVEQVQQLIRAALPGINVHALPVAPRQIPYHAGFSYFELNKQSELWQQMKTSGGFAIHSAGNFPGLALEFWAIKNG